MKGRLFNLCVWISTVALVATLLLFVAALFLNPWEHRVSFGDSFHVGVWRGCLVVFNDADYGPYRGSIIAMVDDQGNVVPRDLHQSAFGDAAVGIYYRHFLWQSSGDTLWTLMVCLLYPLALFALIPGYAVARKLLLTWREGQPSVSPLPSARSQASP